MHEILIEHKEEDIKWIFEEKINHNQSFSEFSKTEAINLKKLAFFFQDAIHFHPGHLQPKTLILKMNPYFGVFTGIKMYFGFLK